MWGDWPVRTNLSHTARNRRSGGPATVPVGGAGGAVAIPTTPAVATAVQDSEERRMAATMEEEELGPAAALWEPERTRMAGVYYAGPGQPPGRRHSPVSTRARSHWLGTRLE